MTAGLAQLTTIVFCDISLYGTFWFIDGSFFSISILFYAARNKAVSCAVFSFEQLSANQWINLFADRIGAMPVIR